MTFYPQDGVLYRHNEGGCVYRIITNANRYEDGEIMTVFAQVIPCDLSPWVMPTTEFGEKFSYIPNWLDIDIAASQKAGRIVVP